MGSNNGMAPWTGNTTPTPEQTAEVLGRTAGSIEGIHDALAAARSQRSRAVMIMIQADMFDLTVTCPTFAENYAYQPIIQALVNEGRTFRGPVYWSTATAMSTTSTARWRPGRTGWSSTRCRVPPKT